MFDPREDIATCARVLRSRLPEISTARRSLERAELLEGDEGQRYADAEYLLSVALELLEAPAHTTATARTPTTTPIGAAP